MEIRQLEYYIASVEEGSFFKASEKLFTTQPNISKSINKLEKEIGVTLLIRSNKGLRVTKYGEQFYHHAKTVLQQVNIMIDISKNSKKEVLSIASYPSGIVSRSLVNMYKRRINDLRIEYHEGAVQEIIDLVSSGICELGIVYIAKKQIGEFNHILGHKNLEFIKIRESKVCVYMGKNNPLYKEEKISLKELSSLKYIKGVRDFFSVEHHLEYVDLNVINTSAFDEVVLTNSDHLVMDSMQYTDLCFLGIELNSTNYKEVEVKSIPIDSSDTLLHLGYIKPKLTSLSVQARIYLEEFDKVIPIE